MNLICPLCKTKVSSETSVGFCNNCDKFFIDEKSIDKKRAKLLIKLEKLNIK